MLKFTLTNIAFADELLTTPNYIIRIEVNCAEGYVTCNDVTYVGESRKSHNSITLKGKTMHTSCADGITPCRFVGYYFKNGNITYTISESGELKVIQGKDKVLVKEKGAWSYVSQESYM